MSINLKEVHEKATEAAAFLAQDFLDKYFEGQDGGACGFAWVTYYPVNKGNTREGKEERAKIESVGFKKDYTGKTWRLWNPSKNYAQNIVCKYVGAVAYAEVLEKEAGIKVYADQRLD